MAEKKHSGACEHARGPVCNCSCEGRLHGVAIAGDIKTDPLWDITLDEEEAQPFRAQFKRNEFCTCGLRLWHLEIRGYWHFAGWFIRGKTAWLYVHCPKCGDEMSINKLGVMREPTLDEFTEIIEEAP